MTLEIPKGMKKMQFLFPLLLAENITSEEHNNLACRVSYKPSKLEGRVLSTGGAGGSFPPNVSPPPKKKKSFTKKKFTAISNKDLF